MLVASKYNFGINLYRPYSAESTVYFTYNISWDLENINSISMSERVEGCYVCSRGY